MNVIEQPLLVNADFILKGMFTVEAQILGLANCLSCAEFCTSVQCDVSTIKY